MKMLDNLAVRVVDWLEGKRHTQVLREVKGKLLDVGCGANRLVRAYQKQGGEAVGVDVFNFGDADLVVENTAELPFADRSYDTVSLVACLNHIPNRIDVLKELHRILTDDGVLILTMIPPRLSRVWHRLIRKYDEDQTDRGMKAGEEWGFTTQQITAMLTETGFQLVKHRRFVFRLNNLYVARKGEQPHDPGPSSRT